MDKNLFLAFILSAAVILGYYAFFPPEEIQTTATEPQKIEELVTPKQVAMASTAKKVQAVVPVAEQKMVTIDHPLYKAELNSVDGVLKSFYLKNFKYEMEPKKSLKDMAFGLFSSEKEPEPVFDPDRLVNMVDTRSGNNEMWKVSLGISDEIVNYHMTEDRLTVKDAPQTLVMKGALKNGLQIIKEITFHPASYQIDLEVQIINGTGEMTRVFPTLNLGTGNESIDTVTQFQPKLAVAYADEDFEKYDEDDIEKGLALKSSWSGIMDTYFITAAKMDDESSFTGKFSPVDTKNEKGRFVIPRLDYVIEKADIPANGLFNKKLALYMGPKYQDKMTAFAPTMEGAMDLGWFDFLGYPLLSILRWFQGYVVNWGVAIILLTIVVRVAMFPLAYKSMLSMGKMSALGPDIKKIQAKYKDNKERLNREIMAFYKQNKINPVSGCLPMLIQIPIFIGLYQALMPAIELRHQPFALWITDLSAADFTLILPVLMGASMFFQQRLTPSPAMDPAQAKLLKWMPIMFMFFFLDFPTGLVLYWVTSNLLSIGQQLIFNKIKKGTTVAVAVGKKKKKKYKKAK